jgi:hypothetical protein
MFLLVVTAIAALLAWCTLSGPEPAELAVEPARVVRAADPTGQNPLPPGPSVPAVSSAAEDEAAALELLERWSAALRPLFDGGQAASRAGGPAATAASSRGATLPAQEAAPPSSLFDAGAAPACRPGTLRFAASVAAPVDLVVAIDTSGSMSGRLAEVTHWLRELDVALLNAGGRNQLVVVVNPEALRAKAPAASWLRDSGAELKSNIGSNDALGVLLAPEVAPWLPRLRPGARVHLVLVTDDDPARGLPATFVARLTRLAGGALGTEAAPAFRLHALLGFLADPPGQVLAADAPVREARCGVAAGLDYQKLVTRTGGLRASVCDRESRQAFTQALLASFTETSSRPCSLKLPDGARVTAVRAEGQTLSRASLTGWDCLHGSSAYATRGAQLVLCPETCAAAADAGLEVAIACERKASDSE